MLENGEKGKEMEKVFIPGLTAINIKANSKMGSMMDWVF